MTSWIDDPRPGAPCTVIAEVAQAHDGSLGAAHAFIDAAAAAGADAIKFQTHIAAAESTPAEPWRKKFGWQDATRFDYWKRMEFSESQWEGLAAHAREAGLAFLSSPFSPQAVELLKRVGVAGWKVASGEVSNMQMLAMMAETGQPAILSSGMSPIAETDDAVALFKSAGAPLAVLQCTSSYPTPPEKVGLNVMAEFRERYGVAVGLSDHSATIYPGLAAAQMGAEVIEAHIALSRDSFGPDVVASLLPTELKQLCEGVRFIEAMRANPVDKAAEAAAMAPMRAIFSKSVVAARDLSAGAVLAPSDLALKKPGGGLPAARLEGLAGKRLKRMIVADEQIRDEDLEG
ncbi:MAG: N-acetylneuraminate synthase family protein [Pikeienuella sp.]